MTSLSKISKPISGFHGGVSEQPSHVRLVSQHTKIENCYCGVVKGLEKRPGSKFIRDLSLTLNGATDLRAFNFESMGGKYHGYTTNDRNKPLIILDEFGIPSGLIKRSGQSLHERFHITGILRGSCRSMTCS